MGQIPARFEIQKMRCLYLKYILSQDDDSSLKKVFNLQLNQNLRGDWASTVLKDLKELRITETFEEIKEINEIKYRNILKIRINKNALKYLTDKQRSKGKEIMYKDIQMAEYLLPVNSKLSVEQKQRMFSLKNRMIELPENFPNKEMENECSCGKLKNILHIYTCKILNEGNNPKLKYEEIYNGNLQDQIRIFERIDENLKKCEKFTEMK